MITKDLDIPEKKSEQPSSWSVRRLLSMGGSVGKVVSTFNPFEFVFFVMILISGLAELFRSHPSIVWYIFVFLAMAAGFYERNFKVEPQAKEKQTDIKPK